MPIDNLVLETQININRLLGLKIEEDGIKGNETNGALMQMAQTMLKYYNAKSYSDIEDYEYVGIRMGQKYTNKFFDVAFFWDVKNPEKSKLLNFSTLPGLWGSGAIMQPNRIYTTKFPAGYVGTGVLKPNRYKDSWFLVLQNGQIYNSPKFWKVWSGNAYLMQSKAVEIGRDGNKDLNVDYQVYEIDWNGKIGNLGAEIGVNHHGWYDYEGDIVNTLSLACQVYQKSRLNYAVAFWKRSADRKGKNEITYTLIDDFFDFSKT